MNSMTLSALYAALSMLVHPNPAAPERPAPVNVVMPQPSAAVDRAAAGKESRPSRAPEEEESEGSEGCGG